MKSLSLSQNKQPLQSISNRDGDLIPIRIDIEIEGRRFRENILWNIDEPYLTPENFAKIIAEENNLPPAFEHEIASVIRRGIAIYRPYFPQSIELYRVIELDIRIDNISLKDRFEWDINDPNNNPEEFAYHLCSELGLNAEFAVQIAHSIREQIVAYQRQAMEKREDRGRGIEDISQMKKSTRSLLESSNALSNIKSSFTTVQINENNYLRPIRFINNDTTDNLTDWEPRIEILDPNEIKKVEKLEERKARYAKRLR
eukprot:TRINITY_DN3041_c0_g1_i3.p1 TRINITY_DN3041_c0_g1~~TRINITY_DN3041_c0_g1_i3.p1  ORF type:complete len:257 (+),score=52.02 TRINITY_DN3041_c0_g1_i3:346-1116(+)